MKKKYTVDIIGTYPPPIGGTSIHLERLFFRCLNNDIDVVVYDTHGRNKSENYRSDKVIPINKYMKFYLGYLFNKRAKIIHSHTHSWKERAMLTLKAKICHQKVIFTFHSFRDMKKEMNAIERICCSFAIKLADYYIATNSEVEKKLIDWGVSKKKISIISPFIAPSEDAIGELDCNIEELIAPYDFVLCANASNNDHYQGNDLYGLDMCIELQAYLRQNYNCGFLYVLTKVSDEEYLKQIKQMIIDKKVEDSFFLIQHPINFLALIKVAKVFVRPTCTDSRPLSVDESISLGCPAVASNVCWHPDSCILFEARNQDDLNEKVKKVLDNYDLMKENTKNDSVQDEFEAILDVYKKLIQQ